MAQFNIENNLGNVAGDAQNLAGVLGGPLSGAVRTAQTVWAGLNTIMRANPILSIVAILTTLVTFVASRFQPVIDQATAVFSALNVAFDYGIDVLGSWLGLTERSSLSLAETVRQAYELERASQALADAQIESITTLAELNAQSREALLLSSDQTAADEDRIAALEVGSQAIRDRFALQRELLEEEVRILREQQNLASNQREDNEELARLEAALIDLRSQESSQLRTINTQLTALEKRVIAKADADRKAAAALRLKNEQQARENELNEIAISATILSQDLQLQLAQGIINEAEARELNIERIYEELNATDDETIRKQLIAELDQALFEDELRRIQETEDAYDEAEEKRKMRDEQEMMDKQTKLETEQAITDQTIGIASQLGDTLTGLAGESKGLAIAGLVIEQGAAIADIVVQTLRANAKAVAASPLTAGQPFVTLNTISGGLSVAAAVAATAQGIQQINSAGGPAVSGVAGAGGSTSIPFGPTVSTPAVDTTAPTPTAAFGAQNSTPEPARAYVLESDVGGAVANNSRIDRKQRLRRS